MVNLNKEKKHLSAPFPRKQPPYIICLEMGFTRVIGYTLITCRSEKMFKALCIFISSIHVFHLFL